MNTKMDIHITITPKAKSKELYNKLAAFNTDIKDIGDKIHVTTEIDIREDAIEKILEICHEHGECEVKAQMK